MLEKNNERYKPAKIVKDEGKGSLWEIDSITEIENNTIKKMSLINSYHKL